MRIRNHAGNPINQKAKRRFRGYPIATIGCYGPDDKRASKVVVGIVPHENAEPTVLKTWFSDESDVRSDSQVSREISNFLEEHSVKTVTTVDRIIGCPHEEGIDYAEGKPCPKCPFWINRDRWTGELVS